MEVWKALGDFGVRSVVESLDEQGHRNRGGLANSVKASKVAPDTLEIEMNGYAEVLDKGVKPSRVPYSGNGGGGRSLAVEGLMRFGRDKGVRDPLGFAFAVLKKWKKEGNPTRNSRRFSKTGKRTGWVSAFEKRFVDGFEDAIVLDGLD